MCTNSFFAFKKKCQPPKLNINLNRVDAVHHELPWMRNTQPTCGRQSCSRWAPPLSHQLLLLTVKHQSHRSPAGGQRRMRPPPSLNQPISDAQKNRRISVWLATMADMQCLSRATDRQPTQRGAVSRGCTGILLRLTGCKITARREQCVSLSMFFFSTFPLAHSSTRAVWGQVPLLILANFGQSLKRKGEINQWQHWRSWTRKCTLLKRK